LAGTGGDSARPTVAAADGCGPVLGVDAYRAGWVGAVWDGGGSPVLIAAGTIDELVRQAGSLGGAPRVIGIDIPIGLPDGGIRRADVLARRRLGARGSSVFVTPVRAALAAASRSEADRISRELAGIGVSAQAYALRPKVLEVDAWLRAGDRRVVEVHPELSFAQLAGGAGALPGKKTWDGAHRRRSLLATAGLSVGEQLGAAGRAGVDDVLDALAAAWTAHRVVTGRAESLPDPPEVFGDGLAAAIRV
jgi:predicted RNase H-like nuclease